MVQLDGVRRNEFDSPIVSKFILKKIMLALENTYSRIDNVIYENGNPYIILFQKFPDVKILNEKVILYMNKYLQANPTLYKIHPSFDLL